MEVAGQRFSNGPNGSGSVVKERIERSKNVVCCVSILAGESSNGFRLAGRES
jgi:hypothetical protein